MKTVVDALAADLQITKKKAGEIVDSVVAGIVAEVVGNDKFKVSGLGTFSKKDKPARKGRNPKTGEAVDIAAKTVLKFKPVKELAEAV
jgi:DNA-binding protein HU-beta